MGTKEFGLQEKIGICIIIGVGISSFVFAIFLLISAEKLTWTDLDFWYMVAVIELLLGGIGYVLVKERLVSGKEKYPKV